MGQHRVRGTAARRHLTPRLRYLIALGAIVAIAVVAATVAGWFGPDRPGQAKGPGGSATAVPEPPDVNATDDPGRSPDPTTSPANSSPTPSASATITPTAVPTSVRPGVVLGTYRLSQDWADGFIGAVRLRNPGGQAKSWVVQLVFGGDVGTLEKTWISGGPGRASVVRTGQTLTFRGDIALDAGGDIGLYFQFQRSGPDISPVECAVNGTVCSA
ncbi:MAG TPA: cellulose binding domain-containing protein [Micromonosporaceae bacterium]